MTGPLARCVACGRGWGGYATCPNCGGEVRDRPVAPETMPDIEPDQMSEASEEDFEVWARQYDDLNGAPESDDDR